MRVAKLIIKNLFGIKEAEWTGNDIEITGSNGTGKTSFIDAFRYALTNRSGREYIIRNGETEGEVVLEMDNGLTVARKKRTEKADYKLIKEPGVKGDRPESFLREIFKELQLNPVEFINYTKDEQNRIVLDLIEFDWDTDWIKEQFGEVPPRVDYSRNILCVLHEIQSDEGYYFLKRQDINREAHHKKAFITEIGGKLPEGYNADKWEAASVGDMWKKVERIQNDNADIERAIEIVKNRDNKVRSFQADFDIGVAAINREIQSEQNSLKDYIKDLETKKREAMNKLDGLEENKANKIELEQAKFDKNVAQFDGEVKDHIEKSKEEIKPFEDIKKEAEHIELMKSHINQYKDMKKYQDEVVELVEESEEITVKIQHARTLPGEILEKCNIPVKGLTVVDGIPLINGLPISNLSEGEKLDLCVDIATQSESSLDILLIDGAEKLSPENRKNLYAKLKDKGCQFIATVTTKDEDMIVTEL